MFLQQNKPNDSHLWYKVLWMDTILCRECKSACIIVDSGTLVCTNCGLACEQDSSSLLQMYEDRDGSFRGNSCLLLSYILWKHIGIGTCTFHPFSTLYKPSTTHQERAAKCLFNECQQVVAKLSLDSSCLPQLESLVTQAAQLAWPCYKHWLSASSAACVYIVSRMHSKALNMTDCSIAANCIVSEMGRVYQQLVMELKLQVPFEDPFSLLWRVCNVVLTWLFPNSETESSPTRIGRLYHLSCNLLWYAEQRYVTGLVLLQTQWLL